MVGDCPPYNDQHGKALLELADSKGLAHMLTGAGTAAVLMGGL